ncbi:unnamed protein product [Rotaria sp. Silwood1]|nr:unnamed protein product [Rotaria sp. Silwood1]
MSKAQLSTDKETTSSIVGSPTGKPEFGRKLKKNLEWFYSTADSRKQIISDTRYTTIGFIHLQSNQEYHDLNQVQSEMTDSTYHRKPANLTNNNFLFLLSSESVGQLIIREQLSSSSLFISENCLCYGYNDEWKRYHLAFHVNPNLI